MFKRNRTKSVPNRCKYTAARCVFPAVLSPAEQGLADISADHLALADRSAFVPLVLRPWRRNHPFAENHTRLYAAGLLVHDVLLFLSAAAVSLILVEYMVKGCVITLKQSFFQGWICYVAVYAAAYLICGNVRIGVCSAWQFR